MKKTVVVGASPNQSRYAYLACIMLKEAGHPFVPMGIRQGEIGGVDILNIREEPKVASVHTLTLYLSPIHQKEWMDYLLELKPERIIFNPGAGNEVFKSEARKRNIETIDACTLVMIRTGQF